VPAAIDHMARLKPADGPEHQTWRMVIDLLKRDNYWFMLSNGVRMSRARGWDDVGANGRAF
jgi:predicted TIM-barrel fold metal-dependent hydrolase